MTTLIFIQVLGSWFGWSNNFVESCTNWLLLPIRKFVPLIAGSIDLSPMVAILIMQFGGDLIMQLLLLKM